MIERIYIEIGNVCNLNCSFCPSTSRAKKQMSVSEFNEVAKKIKGHTKYAYLHVMGEPLLHKNLGDFLEILNDVDIRVAITTNGTLLYKQKDLLLSAKNLHKVNISLHAPEANEAAVNVEDYIKNCVAFANEAAEHGIYVVFRLWNLDSDDGEGRNGNNAILESLLKQAFPEEWTQARKGLRLARNIFLEYDGIFTWPSESCAKDKERGYCHAIKDQIAILADGTVTPCCLDNEGNIPLGNIFASSLDEILSSPRATAMKRGFENRKLVEPMCKKCTYIKRFDVKN